MVADSVVQDDEWPWSSWAGSARKTVTSKEKGRNEDRHAHQTESIIDIDDGPNIGRQLAKPSKIDELTVSWNAESNFDGVHQIKTRAIRRRVAPSPAVGISPLEQARKGVRRARHCSRLLVNTFS